jgi:hypothetical protein
MVKALFNVIAIVSYSWWRTAKFFYLDLPVKSAS